MPLLQISQSFRLQKSKQLKQRFNGTSRVSSPSKKCNISDVLAIFESCYDEKLELAKLMLSQDDKDCQVISDMMGFNVEQLDRIEATINRH